MPAKQPVGRSIRSTKHSDINTLQSGVRKSSRIRGNEFCNNTRVDLHYSGDNTSRPSWYGAPGNNDLLVRSEIEENLRLHNQYDPATGYYKCCYCDGFFDRSVLEIEHIVPYTSIGCSLEVYSDLELRIVSNDVANLTYACGVSGVGCNQSKSDQPLEIYLQKKHISLDEFFKRTPWAAWMRTANNKMSYRASWVRDYNYSYLTVPYKDLNEALIKKRPKAQAPRKPFKNEMCLVDRRDRYIGNRICIEKLLKSNSALKYLTLQDVRDILFTDHPATFEKQYLGHVMADRIAKKLKLDAVKTGALRIAISIIETWHT